MQKKAIIFKLCGFKKVKIERFLLIVSRCKNKTLKKSNFIPLPSTIGVFYNKRVVSVFLQNCVLALLSDFLTVRSASNC